MIIYINATCNLKAFKHKASYVSTPIFHGIVNSSIKGDKYISILFFRFVGQAITQLKNMYGFSYTYLGASYKAQQ